MTNDLSRSADSPKPPAQLVAVPAPPPTAIPSSQAAEEAAEVQLGSQVQATVPPASGSAMDEAAKQEFLWHTHGYVNEYVRFADTKAAFAGTLASGMLAALYAAKSHVRVITLSYHEWTVATWLAVAATIFLVVSIIFALWTVRPRLRPSQAKGYIFWGSVAAHGKLDLLQTSFHSQSARTLNDHLLHHLFDLSRGVCVPKYRSVSLCITTLGLGAFLAASSLVLQDAPRPASSPPPAPPAAASPNTPATSGNATHP